MQAQRTQAAGGPAKPPSIECRVFSRQTCLLPVSCQPTSAWGRKDNLWAATITDVSSGGACLILQRRFEPGAGLGIELPGTNGDDPYKVLAKVVRVHPLPDGTWELGCKFISPLSEDEVQQLLQAHGLPSAAPQPTEPLANAYAPSQAAKKATPSKKKTLGKVLLQLEVAKGKVVPCRLRTLDVPDSWDPTAGTILTIRLNTRKGPPPLLKMEILRSSVQGEQWTLRGRLHSPAWGDLLRALGISAPAKAVR